jgi:predicted short-subunit dehydrogenase-like oxidoreductase (DUF2520 family)
VFALDGEPLEIAVNRRPLAHAASVLVSNGLTALLSTSADLLASAGVSATQARAALLSLARSSLSDLEAGAPPRGPIGEGDLDAVDLHLRSLRGDARELYRGVSRILLDDLEDRPASADVTDALRFLLRTPLPESPEDDT